MPRGSKPGTKCGGRKRGTPNRRTILADRIFVAAAAHPEMGWQELHAILVDDQALPADTRVAIAQKSRLAARSHQFRGKTTNAKSAKATTSRQQQAELDSLLRLTRDASLAEQERRQAANRIAWLLLPATPTGDRLLSRAVADEYGFVISPKIAHEYRDAKLQMEKLKDSDGLIKPGNAHQADKLEGRLAAIRRSLDPPPHARYGMYGIHQGRRDDQPVGRDQYQQDYRRLSALERKRRSKIGLTREEVAEEAHRIARVDTLDYGAEGEAKRRLAKLEKLATRAREMRRGLKPWAKKDLRLLRVLYGKPRTLVEDPEVADYHALRDERPANDGNLYPRNSKLRPPPLWIDEDGVEIADQPKVFYDDPHYWPYTAVDPYHVSYVAQLPCLVCGGGPVHAHRLGFTEQLARKVSDEFTVPLCRDHHDDLKGVSDEAAWWKRIGVDPLEAARMLWRVTHPDITAQQLRGPAEGLFLRSRRLTMYADLAARSLQSVPPQTPTGNLPAEQAMPPQPRTDNAAAGPAAR